MMQTIRATWVLFSACSFFLIAGCSSVYSINPVGEKPAQIDAALWDGNWLGADGVMTIKVIDADGGILQVAWIEDMKLEKYQVYLMESGNWLFFNLKDEDQEGDEEDPGYFWGRIKKDDNSITLWDPDISKFRALVTEGVLPGEAKKSGKDNEHDSDVILGELTAEHLRIIVSEEKGVLFDWDDPLVLLKILD